MTTELWIVVGSFAGIASVVYLLLSMIGMRQRNPVRDRLDAVALRATIDEDTEPPDEGLDLDLRRAGYYRANARAVYAFFRSLMVVTVIVGAGAVIVALGPERDVAAGRVLLIGLSALGLAWALPRIYLRAQGRMRTNRLRRSLPDALDLMTMCLTGGLSLRDSLEHVQREVRFAHPDLATELAMVSRHADMRSFEFAFDQFARRADTEEISALNGLIAHAHRLGTDVAGAIREFADELRLKRRQTADARSSKAGVKLLFPLTMCALPSVFIILWGPSALELYSFIQSMQGTSP